MKRINFPEENKDMNGAADGSIPAERVLSEYQSRQFERMLNEARLREYALTFLKNGGNIL